MLLACTTAAQPAPPAEPPPLVIRNVSLVHSDRGRTDPGQTVLIQNGRIHYVGLKAAIPRNAVEIDGTGKYLIPGLWDCHAYAIDHARAHLGGGYPTWQLLLAYGVTTVRDAGSALPLSVQRRLADSLAQPAAAAPRVLLCGKALSGTTADPLHRNQATRLRNAAELTRAVDTLQQRGADYLRLEAQLPSELVSVAVAAGNSRQLPTVGSLASGFADAATAGVAGIEQLLDLRLTTGRGRAAYAAYRRSGLQRDSTAALADSVLPDLYRLAIAPDPPQYNLVLGILRVHRTPLLTNATQYGGAAERLEATPERMRHHSPRQRTQLLQASMSPQVGSFRWYRHQLQRIQLQLAHEADSAGIALVAGTGFQGLQTPGASLHDELELLVAAGLSPAEALTAATLAPARMLRRQHLYGLEKGKVADLVLLDANPLVDIANTRRILAVVKGGRLFMRHELDTLLNTAAAQIARLP